MIRRVMLDATPVFQVGDPCPEGYIARQEWAEVHHAAGLKQEMCSHCRKWKWPHELTDKLLRSTAYRDKAMTKPVEIVSRICVECDSVPSGLKRSDATGVSSPTLSPSPSTALEAKEAGFGITESRSHKTPTNDRLTDI